MDNETLLMIILSANIAVSIVNMIVIKNLMNFWTECLDAIKKIFDSNAKISKDLIKVSRNFIGLMGLSEPPKAPKLDKINIVHLED